MLSERGSEDTNNDPQQVYFIGMVIQNRKFWRQRQVSLLCRYGSKKQRGLYSDEELEDCSCGHPLLFSEDKE